MHLNFKLKRYLVKPAINYPTNLFVRKVNESIEPTT